MIEFMSLVRFTDAHAHRNHPEYYPKTNTVGVVWGYSPARGAVAVQWPNCTTSGNDLWCCDFGQIADTGLYHTGRECAPTADRSKRYCV